MLKFRSDEDPTKDREQILFVALANSSDSRPLQSWKEKAENAT